MIKKHPIETIFILGAFLFSIWLMFSTFSYHDSSIYISAKLWSDFAAHIPLIRSFSLGNNFPPEYPLFPGLPIRYHFLFYLLVGLLEKTGLNISLALNIPSALGFFALLLMIYFFARLLFKNFSVGLLSVIFFLFNGSFAFREFFNLHPLSLNTFRDVIQNPTFAAFGPYDGKIVSAFWNLNIYTNQRHLALSFAVSLLIIFLLLQTALKKTKLPLIFNLSLGILLGISFFWHFAVFLMTVLVLLGIFVLFPPTRKQTLTILVVDGLIALPQYLYIRSQGSGFQPFFAPGYLAGDGFLNILTYWFYNLGLHFFLIPLGVIFAPANLKKVLLIFIPLFLVGNLFQFSSEIAANHKFFNLFMIPGVMFSAFALITLWKKRLFFRPLVVITGLLLTLSGLIDFFPIVNDYQLQLPDYPKNKDVAWIVQNTAPEAVFLSANYLYDPASLAGRKIFLGWPYFSWSAGYDTNSRSMLVKQILKENNRTVTCFLLNNNNISYIESDTKITTEPDLQNTSELFSKEFAPVYSSPISGLVIYDVKNTCQNI